MAYLAHFLVALSYLSVALAGFYTYYEWYRKRISCFVSKHMLAFGILFLIPAAMNFMWSAAYLPPDAGDFGFVTAFFAVVASMLSLLLVYSWTGSRHLLYIFPIYGLTVIAAYIDPSLFSSALMLASFLVALVSFLELFISSSHHIKLGSVLGTGYAVFSILLIALSFLKVPYPQLLWGIPNFFLASALCMIYIDGKYCMLLHPKPAINFHHRKLILHVVFLRYLFYTLSITGLLFVSAISIHELGHALASSYYGCEQARIVFDLKSFPHTEISCPGVDANQGLITIAGLLATSAIGVGLLLTSESFSMRLGRLLLGYGFLIGYRDFIDLGISENVAAVIGLITLLALIASFYEISRYYIESQRSLFASEPEQGSHNHQEEVRNIFIGAKGAKR